MTPWFQANNVMHHFGGVSAISGFNLELRSGELVGLIGPNGAGKTTVFNLITGVYRSTEGSIRFQGHELVGLSPWIISGLGIARTFQNIRIFKQLSVLDNVRIAYYQRTHYSLAEALLHLGRYRREERRLTQAAMEILRLLHLESYAGEPADSLPYGLQRRLEIGRALATGATLLLLDEPAAGMNPNEVGQLMEFIGWIRRQFNLTILLIEHQMRVVTGICERVLVLDFGVTIAEGRPDEIQNNPQVLEAYLGQAEDGGKRTTDDGRRMTDLRKMDDRRRTPGAGLNTEH